MIVYICCPKCNKRHTLGITEASPLDLVREHGETMRTTCSKCLTVFDADAMRTRARINPLIVGLGAVGSLVLAIAVWNMGFIAGLSLAPVVIAYQNESNSVNAYNKLSRAKYG